MTRSRRPQGEAVATEIAVEGGDELPGHGLAPPAPHRTWSRDRSRAGGRGGRPEGAPELRLGQANGAGTASIGEVKAWAGEDYTRVAVSLDHWVGCAEA